MVITRLAVSTLTVAAVVASTTLFGQQPQKGPKSGCDNQARSLAELKRAFAGAKMPSPAELSGSWVAIGIFGAAHSHGTEIASVECAGLRRGKTLEQVMLIKGNFVDPRFIGAPPMPMRALTPDGRGSLEFAIDFGGDANPRYRCRLTATGTLACLVDVYDEGVEFKRNSVSQESSVARRAMVTVAPTEGWRRTRSTGSRLAHSMSWANPERNAPAVWRSRRDSSGQLFCQALRLVRPPRKIRLADVFRHRGRFSLAA